MKSTSIIRLLAGFDRIVLPEDFRAKLGIEEGTEIEFCSNGDMIVLSRYVRASPFIGVSENIIMFRRRYVCRKFIFEMPGCDVEEHSRQ